MTVPFNESIKLFSKFAPLPAVDPTTQIEERLVYWAGFGMPVTLALTLAVAAGGSYPTPAMKMALIDRYKEAFEAGLFETADGTVDADAKTLYEKVLAGRCVYGFFQNYVFHRFYSEAKRPSDAEELVNIILSD